ncbi:MAG: TonB-dependent receptor plug domain-containing protein, partial [Nevskiales bacterium]
MFKPLIGLVVFALSAGIAHANETGDEENNAPETPETQKEQTLETITVTGEKLGRTLADTASSVAITTGEDLADTPEQDLSELLRRSANVAAPRDDKFSLRGINNQGLTGRIRQAASTFVDGTRIEARGVVHAFDLEQVEIYRGPQSTTFGPNSLAGAIAVKTRDPQPYWGLDALLGGGEAGSRQYALAGGGPITENLSFRITGDFNETDGQVSNTTRHDDEWQGQERKLGRA